MKNIDDEILESVTRRYGPEESRHRMRTFVRNISSEFELTKDAARRKLDKLVKAGKLKKDSHPGWANAYFPV